MHYILILVASFVLSTLSQSVSAQPAGYERLTEWPTEDVVNCRYAEDGVIGLDWAENRDKPALTIDFYWRKRSPDDQIGDCNYKKGFADSCERVSFYVRIRDRSLHPPDHWGWQAIYHYDGGIEPSDLCRKL